MPIYEYECPACGATNSIWVPRPREPEGLKCTVCQQPGLKRIVSAVHYHVSAADRLAAYTPGAEKNDRFYRDSRNIGLRAEHMLKQAGVEPPESFKAKLDNLRSDPSRVLKE